VSGLSEQRRELGRERVSSAGREDTGLRLRAAERSEAIKHSLSLALLGLSGSYSPPTWNERVMTTFLAEP